MTRTLEDNMQTIILLKGLMASGKSTWALEEMRRNPGKYKRINKDLMRAMIDGDHYTPKNERFILDIRDRIVEKALLGRYDVIIDDTNFSDKHWVRMCEIARYIGDIRVREKYFPITLKEALERNSKRTESAHVPEDIIINVYDKHFKHKNISVRDEYFEKKKLDFSYLKDEKKQKAIIVDIDGTLALMVNRGPYDLSLVIEDQANEPVCELVRLFQDKGYIIILLSGREDMAKEDTILWLNEANVPYDALYMRETGDNRKDSIVKEELYRKYIMPHFNVHYVIDDRPQVVRMWRRKFGFTVLQVNDMEF